MQNENKEMIMAFCKKWEISYPLNPEVSSEDFLNDRELQKSACKDLFAIVISGCMDPVSFVALFPSSVERIDALNKEKNK